MKLFCLLGLVVVSLAGPATQRFDGHKVFRVKPATEQAVRFVKSLADVPKLDLWQPDSLDQVVVGINVDFRVGAEQVAEVQGLLERSGLQYQVLIKDLQTAIDEQFDNGDRASYQHSYVKYNSIETINQWMATIVAQNSDMMSYSTIGSSYEGRPLHVIKIGKKTGSVKPAIFMDCGIHAREWISPAFCQWFVNEAVSTYGSDPTMTDLLNTMDFLVVPVINVDGYSYTWTNDRMWRKTRSRNPGTNCRGTDPNRNWNAGWCEIGASKNPCSETYCGPVVESEKVVKAVADYIRSQRSVIKAYLTMHSYSQMCLFPYSYTYNLAANHEELVSLTAINKLGSMYGTQYVYGPGAVTIYPAAGGSDDWAYDEGIKYAFTFELRDTGRYGFLLPESQIKPTCEETMLAIKYISQYVSEHLY
uniref:Carboxypeptidase B n=1 Tax=Callorhinchus milii TaxID=7868 RepID=A0A4W3IAT4_CALMI